MIKEHFKKLVGKRILFLRELRGLTQDEFADQMGYESGSSMISQIENGGAGMLMDKIRRAAEILQVSPAVILTEQDLSDENLLLLSDFLKLLSADTDHSNLAAIKTLIKASM